MRLVTRMARLHVVLEQLVRLELPGAARPLAHVRLLGRVDQLVLAETGRV